MGLTDKGYVLEGYETILNGLIQHAKELFGEDMDTGELTMFGKLLRLYAYDLAKSEERNADVYFSRFPNSASGQSLDRLLIFGGLTRNAATAAVFNVQIQGESGYVVETGFLVGTETGLTYYTTSEATIGEDGTVLVEVCCTEAGTIGNVSAAAINTITNPDASVAAVIGKECLTLGTDEESDVDLRARLKAAIAGAGSCNENAISAALLRIPTVQYAAVFANDTDETDAEGRPPHSFECYVLGGEDYEQEIAEAIYEKRPVGIRTTGDKAVTVINASGREAVVYYTPAPEVKITVSIQLKTAATFAADGADQVFAAVSKYINSLGIGKSLVLSTLYGHIYSVTGVTEVTSLKVSTDSGASYSTDNVTIPQYGVAVCEDVLVEVVTE